MNEIVQELLNFASIQDLKVQEEALLQIRFIFERSNTIRSGDDDSMYFPTRIHNIRLTEEEQHEVCMVIADLFLTGKYRRAAIFATMGTATRTAAVGPVLKAIGALGEFQNDLEDRTIEQAVGILIKMLVYPVDLSNPEKPVLVPVPEVALQLRNYDVIPTLKKLEQTKHPYYSEMAKQALELIPRYGEALDRKSGQK